MAIRLRCTHCTKKLSLDEGFVGGVCRCPYCKALVMVPRAAAAGRPGTRTKIAIGRPMAPAGRPAAPSTRPEAPGSRPEAPPSVEAPSPSIRSAAPRTVELPEVPDEHVPLARPVRIQGLAAMVLLGAVVLMVATMVFLLVKYGPMLFARDEKAQQDGAPGATPTTQPVQPALAPVSPPLQGKKDRPVSTRPPITPPVPAGPNVDGIELTAPVVYCVGAGGGAVLDFAVGLMLDSMESLSAGSRFSIILCEEQQTSPMPGGYAEAGPEALERADTFRQGAIRTSHRSLAEAVRQAAEMDPPPKTIVVFAASDVGDADAAKIVESANAAKARIVTIVLTDEKPVIESLRRLSEQPDAKGSWKRYERGVDFR